MGIVFESGPWHLAHWIYIINKNIKQIKKTLLLLTEIQGHEKKTAVNHCLI